MAIDISKFEMTTSDYGDSIPATYEDISAAVIEQFENDPVSGWKFYTTNEGDHIRLYIERDEATEEDDDHATWGFNMVTPGIGWRKIAELVADTEE